MLGGRGVHLKTNLEKKLEEVGNIAWGRKNVGLKIRGELSVGQGIPDQEGLRFSRSTPPTFLGGGEKMEKSKKKLGERESRREIHLLNLSPQWGPNQKKKLEEGENLVFQVS